MNNKVKMIILLIILLLAATLFGIWAKAWSSSQKQGASGINEIANTLSPDIPEELSEVAEIEYAIEFEANKPEMDIDLQFCNFVKSKCEEQGIKNCEDYKMCLEGLQSVK